MKKLIKKFTNLFRYKKNVFNNIELKWNNTKFIKFFLNFIFNLIHAFYQRLLFLIAQIKRFFCFLTKLCRYFCYAFCLNFKKNASPLVSIIIPYYKHSAITIDCLKSIKKSKDSTKFEIIIADDCSPNFSRHLLKLIRGIRIIRTKSNLGYIKNVNNASLYAEGKYLYFLNNDTLVKTKWLEPLIETFNLYKDCGVVGSKVLRIDNKLQEFGVFVFKNYENIIYYEEGEDPYLPKFNNIRKCDYVSGCSMLVNKDNFKLLGGFSTYYNQAYFDDIDFCLRMKKELNLSTYVNPDSIIRHLHNVSYDSNEFRSKIFDYNKKVFLNHWLKYINNNMNSFNLSDN